MDERDAEVQEPVAQLAAELRYLRLLAGKPSVTRLKKLTERQGVGRGIPRATIQDKLSGATAPTLEHVLALVTACAEHAAGIGQPLPREAIDDNRWRAAWLEMQRARADPRRRQAGAQRDRLEFVNGPSEVMPTSITKATDVPPAQRRRSTAEYEQELRRYANVVHELVDRQFSLFEERVEITLTVGEQDGQDIISERRWTSPRPYLVYRIVGPIVLWPDSRFKLNDLETACQVKGQENQVHIHSVRDVDGRPMLMIFFQPGLHADTEWVLSYRSPNLWNPLRSSGQDSLSWSTSTFDQRHPGTVDKFTLKVVFPSSWTGARLIEQSHLGEVYTERLPTGLTQVTWHRDAPHALAYHWVIHGSAAS